MEKDTVRTSSPDDAEKCSSTQDVVVTTDDSSDSELAIDPKAEARLLRRIDMRIVPASFFISLLCFLDRANIGNAKILNNTSGHSLAQTLHISNQQYLDALLIFIVGYTIFEVPSNYMLHRFRPSVWIAFLMLGWGMLTMVLAAVRNFPGLVVVRFLLGAFEADLFPGLVYCLTYWYKPDERALRVVFISGGSSLAGAFGGAIAFGVGHMNGLHGLQGWRWLFLLEGLPSIVCAALVYACFPDYPEASRWLAPADRALAARRVRGVASRGGEHVGWAAARATLLDARLYLHYLVSISFSVGFSSISLFAPTIVSGLGYAGLRAQLFTVPPYAIAFVVTIFIAWQADRRGVRSLTALTCMFMAGVCFLIQGLLPAHAFKARYGMLCIAVPFLFAIQPPLLSWLTGNLRSTGAATFALPTYVAIDQVGQIVGIYIYKSNEAPGYPTGHFTNAAFNATGRWLLGSAGGSSDGCGLVSVA